MTCEECTTSQLAAYKLTKAEQLTKASTHKPINSKLIDSKNSSTQKARQLTS